MCVVSSIAPTLGPESGVGISATGAHPDRSPERLEPGPPLQRLEQAILRQDASLEPPAARWRLPPRARLIRRARCWSSCRRRWVAAVAVTVAAVIAVGLLLGPGAAPRTQATLARANGLLAVDVASGRPVAATRLDGAPEALSGGASSVWVTDPGGGAVTRIDPGSGAAVDRILVGGEPGEHRQRRRRDLGGEHGRRHGHPDRPSHRKP